MAQAPLSERDFEPVADATLHALEGSLSDVPGIEVELSSGILTLEFSDGTKFVINSHRAAREIWMAANLEAWHFGYLPAEARWVAGRGGEELWATVERIVGQRLGRALTLHHGR